MRYEKEKGGGEEVRGGSWRREGGGRREDEGGRRKKEKSGEGSEKKIRPKFALIKKFVTRTPVSTKQTNRVDFFLLLCL